MLGARCPGSKRPKACVSSAMETAEALQSELDERVIGGDPCLLPGRTQQGRRDASGYSCVLWRPQESGLACLIEQPAGPQAHRIIFPAACPHRPVYGLAAEICRAARLTKMPKRILSIRSPDGIDSPQPVARGATRAASQGTGTSVRRLQLSGRGPPRGSANGSAPVLSLARCRRSTSGAHAP